MSIETEKVSGGWKKKGRRGWELDSRTPCAPAISAVTRAHT